jgi:hypothetical protein
LWPVKRVENCQFFARQHRLQNWWD